MFLTDRKEWHGWNEWRGNRNDFSRPYILSFMKFYPEHETWLFGGIYEVLERRNEPNTRSYTCKLLETGKDLIGRLKISASVSRGRAFNLENLNAKLTVTEVLKNPYSGQVFPGYENVSIDLHSLDVIRRNQRQDWKTALINLKGVYLLVDKQTGRKYVGSAYGDLGIWSRWENYLDTGHGGNVGLRQLLSGKDPRYAHDNFKITLLETWPFKTPDNYIIQRENFWKSALLTRGDFGYNKN